MWSLSINKAYRYSHEYLNRKETKLFAANVPCFQIY